MRCNKWCSALRAQKKAAAGDSQSRQRPVRKKGNEDAPSLRGSAWECSIGREGPTRGATGGGSAWDSAQSRCRKAESAAAKCKEGGTFGLGEGNNQAVVPVTSIPDPWRPGLLLRGDWLSGNGTADVMVNRNSDQKQKRKRWRDQ